MKIALVTKEFSAIKRIGKKIERRFNHLRYKMRGDRFKAWTCTFDLGWHWDLAESLIKGATYYPEIELLINPQRRCMKDSIVYLPTNWRALHEMIPLRRSGYISKLITGSDLRIFSDKRNFLVAGSAMDACLFESEWVKKVFEEKLARDGLEVNAHVWAAGVDENLWSPRRLPGRSFDKVLVYVKRSGAELLPYVKSVLEKKNKEYQTIVYGGYLPGDYKTLLEQSDFVIVLGESETQGMAIFQAWSMDRQTLVYDSSAVWASHLRTASAAGCASSAPYLTPQNGAFWKDIDELEYLLDNMNPRSAREWILTNYTNKHAFANLLDVIKAV